ncbi:MAG: hypothetical protein HY762_05790 [Planctomycetes bacterium]|nr:hypothetical protein [Planctomycetota bacterium]
MNPKDQCSRSNLTKTEPLAVIGFISAIGSILPTLTFLAVIMTDKDVSPKWILRVVLFISPSLILTTYICAIVSYIRIKRNKFLDNKLWTLFSVVIATLNLFPVAGVWYGLIWFGAFSGWTIHF